LRKADDDDIAKVEELRRLGSEALPVFKRLAAETNEDMHPVMVEYLFDGDKAVFFFEAEERIDFRDLVRRLAGEFHVRVDMRQIGVRDEARLIGGLGHCGQELCCKRLGGEFCPVSIRMAKEQDLSLNPQKISGVCGRLMCCLRYEYDAYKEFKSRAPKANAKISTSRGSAKVIELDVPREMVTVRLEDDGKKVKFPLSAMDAPEEGSNRPSSIGDAFEAYADPDPLEGGGNSVLFDTAGFTRDDKLAAPEARHNPRSPRKKTDAADSADRSEGQSDGRKPRRRKRKGPNTQDAQTGQKQKTRSNSNGASGEQSKGSADTQSHVSSGGKGPAKQNGKHRNRGAQGGSSAPQNRSSQTVRPGQKSSGLANDHQHRNKDASAERSRTPRRTAPDASALPANGTDAHRRARRRSHKTGGDEHEA